MQHQEAEQPPRRQAWEEEEEEEEEKVEEEERVIFLRSAFPSECVLACISFLSVHECSLCFGLTGNKKLYDWYLQHESLVFRIFLLRDVSTVQQLPQSCFAGACDCLCISSAIIGASAISGGRVVSSERRLYQALRPFSTKCIFGYYRVVPPLHERGSSYMPFLSRGGLVLLRRSPSRLIIESVQPTGQRVVKSVLAFDAEQERLCDMVVHSQRRPDPVVATPTGGLIISNDILPNLHLEPLNTLVEVTSQEYLENDLLTSLTGLYTAAYGGHGLEIIEVSLVEAATAAARSVVVRPQQGFLADVAEMFGLDNDAEEEDNQGESQEYPLQLQGLKIVGDPNVPANQLTFCVNGSVVMDHAQALLEDPRPVAMMAPSLALLAALQADGEIQEPQQQHEHQQQQQQLNVEIVDFTARLDKIGLWLGGYGQINMNPSHWQPKWVAVNLIVYKKPLSTGARFSLIWADEGNAVRHGMEFYPTPTVNRRKQQNLDDSLLRWAPAPSAEAIASVRADVAALSALIANAAAHIEEDDEPSEDLYDDDDEDGDEDEDGDFFFDAQEPPPP